jgi:hypothetical protein
MAMTHLTVPAMVTALLSHNALAEEFGAFEEARELLNRATAAVKADKQQALKLAYSERMLEFCQ